MDSTESTPEPQQLSKRALKRLAKQQKDTAGTSTESVVSSGPSSTVAASDQVIEHIQKRIRNLQKRKQRLDKYQEIADSSDPAVAKSLNQDQLAALQNKDSVEAPLKELKEILNVYKEQEAKVAADHQAQQAQQEAAAKEREAKARAEGLAEGIERLSLTVKFLRAASYKRQLIHETPADENAGMEHMLQLVYNGDETALEAIAKLQQALEEPVVENAISYAQIKAIALTPPEKFFEKAPESNADQAQENDASNQQNQPVQTISFLQEEVNDDPETAPGATDTTNGQQDANGSATNSKNGNGQAKGQDKTSDKRKHYRRRNRGRGKREDKSAAPAPASN
uniref:ARAD1C12452p n=1 Tax=Blastobotrys adeninivorans TaxID=409370 RepID=A0A060SZZ1_BLAAD